MVKWQYRFIGLGALDTTLERSAVSKNLSESPGSDGWELVSIFSTSEGFVASLKRPIPENSDIALSDIYQLIDNLTSTIERKMDEATADRRGGR